PSGRRARGVATDAGILEAETVVVAAGPWSAQLLRPAGIHLPVVGARGWLVRVDARPGLIRHVVGRTAWHAAWGREGLQPARVAALAAAALVGLTSSPIPPSLDTLQRCRWPAAISRERASTHRVTSQVAPWRPPSPARCR